MFGNRLIKSNNAGAACTTDTVQILDGTPLESIATYQLNNATTSIPNNTYPGTFTNPAYAAGKFGQAAVFNGSSGGIDLPSNTPISNQINGTVSLWFNVLSNTKKETLIRFANNDEVLFRININGTLDLIGVRQSNNSYISYTTSGTYNDGTWHHLVMTRESGSIKFYIDDNLDNTLSWNNTFVTASNETAIGWDGYTSSSTLTGSIDQVRIFNTALSATDVTDLYDEQYCFDNFFNDDSTVATYKLNNTAFDDLGNYNGTASNVTYAAGKFDEAAVFNGSTSKIDLPVSVASSSVLTVSLWFKSTTNDSPAAIFSARGSASNQVKFVISLNRNAAGDGKIGIDGASSSGFLQLGVYDGNYNDGVWHNVVASINYTTKDYFAYIDNVLRISGNNSSLSLPASYDKVSLGVNYASQYFNGSIDQVRIFNRALTAGEVTQLANE